MAVLLAALLAVFVMWAVLIIHELGHFVACLLMGVPVESFKLGSPVGPRLHLRLGKYFLQVSLLPFEASTIPKEGEEKDLRQTMPGRLAIVGAAGPVANLLSVGVLALTLGLGDKFWLSLTPFGLFSLGFGSIGVPLTVISTLIILLMEGPGGVLPAFAVLSVAGAIFSLLPFPLLSDGDLVMGILTKFDLSRKRVATIGVCYTTFLMLIAAVITAEGSWVRLSQWLF